MNNDEAMRWWFTGLADGESWFRMYKHPTNISWTFQFGIKLRADDRGTLVIVQDYLGGKLYRSNESEERKKYHGRENAKPAWTLSVHKREDLYKVLSHFEAYPLRSKKKGDFKIWSEALRCWHECEYGTRLEPNAQGNFRGMYKRKPLAVFERVAALKEELRQYREFFE